MKHGLYRIHGIGGQPDDVRIDLGGITAPLEESLYRARHHLPPVDELPWQEAYFAKNPAAKLSGA
jgi:hypothetical protein